MKITLDNKSVEFSLGDRKSLDIEIYAPYDDKLIYINLNEIELDEFIDILNKYKKEINES